MSLVDESRQAPLDAALFAPLQEALEGAKYRRNCPSLPDDQWLRACVSRVLDDAKSGRGFLQTYSVTGDYTIEPTLFFENLASDRRLRMVQSVAEALAQGMAHDPCLVDPFASYADLANYEIFAGDGHYHEAATHDKRIDGTKYATGQFFGLNLRTSALFHLAVADQNNARKKEHDMRALKRMAIDRLRQGTPTGRRVIWTWDRAGIDAKFWQDLKQSAGIYFISMAKENMRLDPIGELPYDRDNQINNGVTGFELVSVGGQALRCVRYCDPATGKELVFLTSLVDVPPGLVALIYKLRWDIEKTFDETKTKLCERKAWGSSPTAKAAQAAAVCMAHNLLVMLERRLEEGEGIRNEKEEQRRIKRAEILAQVAKDAGRAIPRWPMEMVRRSTQRAIGFIRWVRVHLGRQVPWATLTDRLRAVYAGRSG